MTGKAREPEVRIMGLGLAALAVLTTFLVVWVASAVGAKLHAQAPDASLTHSPGGAALALHP